MPTNYTPAGQVGTPLQEATVGEATGTHGTVFMRANIETIGNQTRFLNDDGTISSEAVVAPTLVNSWVDFGGGVQGSGYYKDRAGRVHIRGCIKSGSVPSTAFTLPAGYRPLFNITFAVESNGAHGAVSITNAGVVSITTGSSTAVHLNGISFLAV